MSSPVYAKIVALVREASALARSIGIANLLQPGLVKEMIIADLLGHDLISTKRDADARSRSDPTQLYEYLSCKEGGSGQLDRMFSRPPAKRAESMRRITRNHRFFLAIFYADDQTRCKIIYELAPKVVAAETERQLDASGNAIAHVGFGENWARRHGTVAYRDAR